MPSKQRTIAVIVGGERFDCSIAGFAWQAPDALLSVDATLEISAVSKQDLEHEAVFLIHGNLQRPNTAAPFATGLDEVHVVELIEAAFAVWAEPDGFARWPGSRLRLEDSRWHMKQCPVAVTRSERWVGAAARATVAQACRVADEEWMQDWPCEVSDGKRLGEFCAYYDSLTDEALRFATITLILHSYDQCEDQAQWSEWIDLTLRRDFAIHGHTFATWAALDADSTAFGTRETRDLLFTSSLQLRRIWDEVRVPLAIAWCAAT
ncbi:MAG TPA: hypothetical protein PLF40_12315 [Kofleriaceae bacterium]|nr:hypothetical protein [Kofleriaceae bacterium]